MPMATDRSATSADSALAAFAGFARTSGLAGFFAWWMRELAAIVPAPARHALARRRLRPVIAFDADEATLWRPTIEGGETRITPLARIPLAGDANAVADAGRAALASLERVAYGGTTGATRVRVTLPARTVLRRRLVLPAAVEENLRQAVGYDLDRLTPFKADELYYDAVVVGRDAARATLDVDFAAVRRPVVDQALARARSWGVEVGSVSPDRPAEAAVSRLNLVPEEERAVPRPWRRWQFWLPIALLALLATVAVVLPVLQKRYYALDVIERAEAARQQAAVSEKLRADLERAAGEYNFVLQRKFAYPPMVRVLDEVTRALPDDTWLTQFEVRSLPKGRDRERELSMRGESGNAGRLIPVLEETGLVVQVAPRSPTTKIQPGPGEIFDLAAQLKALPKPEPVALVAGAPVTETAAGATPTRASTEPARSAEAPPSPPPAAAPVSTPSPAASPPATSSTAPPPSQAVPAPGAPSPAKRAAP